MVTQRQNSASSVVGLIFVTEIIDNWRAVKSIMPEMNATGHCASAYACPQTIKRLKTYLYAPSRSGGKILKTHLTLSLKLLNMGPHFKYLP